MSKKQQAFVTYAFATAFFALACVQVVMGLLWPLLGEIMPWYLILAPLWGIIAGIVALSAIFFVEGFKIGRGAIVPVDRPDLN